MVTLKKNKTEQNESKQEREGKGQENIRYEYAFC